MFTSLARSLAPQNDKEIIKVDPTTGFSQFPDFGDTKKHLLAVYIDPESEQLSASVPSETTQKFAQDADRKEFWMPDKYCKVCYGCEDSFTMYRRRHHCRMCGQVFCSPCSNFYIDGSLINLQGPVRSCRLCYDQLFERTNRENKLSRRRSDQRDIDSGRMASCDVSTTSLNAKPGTAILDNLQKR